MILNRVLFAIRAFVIAFNITFMATFFPSIWEVSLWNLICGTENGPNLKYILNFESHLNKV